MKARLLTVLLALGMICSSNAFASRARILVMGQGDGGFFLPADTSFLIDDERNVFYNPSYTNDFKNWGIIEKSNAPGITGEGGMVTAISSYSLGAYFNRGDSETGFAEAANMRPIDVLFGGDTGTMKYGLGLNYGNFDDGAGAGVSQALTLNVGLQLMDLEPFGWYRIIGNDYESLGAAGEAHDKSWGVGFRYKMGEWTPWAGFRSDSTEDVASGNNVTDYKAWIVGIGRNTKIAEGARLAYSLSYVHANAPSAAMNVVPINTAIEGDALSWLTLRAGLGFNWWDRAENTTLTDNTSARIGATMHFGKADFEFAVGRNADLSSTAETANTSKVAGVNSGNSNNAGSLLDSQTFDIASGFFTAANVSYHW